MVHPHPPPAADAESVSSDSSAPTVQEDALEDLGAVLLHGAEQDVTLRTDSRELQRASAGLGLAAG